MLKNRLLALVAMCFVGVTVSHSEALPQHKFSGDISLGGDRTSGNTETSTFDGKLALGYEYGDWSSDFTFKASQTKDGGVLISDYYEAILKGKYEIGYNIYGLLQLGYREDFFGGIYSEKSYIGALGYHVFASDKPYSLDLELGAGERITKKVNKIKVDYDAGTHVAILGAYKFTDDDVVKAQFSGEYGNDDDYIKKELSWVHQLFGGLNLDFGYETRTITAPAAGKVDTDTKVSLKLGYGF